MTSFSRLLSVSAPLAVAGMVSLLGTSIGADTAQAQCAGRTNALGVSRTVTIDASGGKLYGGLQYDAGSLLKDGEVILTFDDGPLRRHTRKVMKALASHCTKGTFFMVGRMAVADPAMVREVASAGHTIANHTWSHKNLHRRSARRAGGEIELGISAVRIAAQKPISPFFRFPYLADPNTMLAYGKQRNLAIFSIDIDSNDYKTRSSERVFGTIMRQLRARRKGIMLFHDIQPSTAGAMQRILDTMQREGFKVVHVVAKNPVTTLKEFDEQAQGLHDKRRTVATANAVDGGAFENVAGVKRRTRAASTPKPAAAKVATRRPQKRERRVNPYDTSTNRTVRIAQPGVRPDRKTDWRKSVWGN